MISSLFPLISIALLIHQTSPIQLDMTIHNKDNNNNQSLNKTNNRVLFELDLNVRSNKNQITTNICLGEPQQCFDLAYDTAIHHTWVVENTLAQYARNSYDFSQSTTVIKGREDYSVEENMGYGVEEKIRFNAHKGVMHNNNNQELFNMLILFSLENNKALPYDGALGLNRQYEEISSHIEKGRIVNQSSKFSIIEYLYKNKYIAQKVFAHRKIENHKAILYIGEKGTKENHYPTCECKTESRFENSYYASYWHCSATALYNHNTQEKIIDLNLEAVFDSNLDYIVFPREKGRQLYEYLKTEGYLKRCKLFEIETIGYTIKCENIDKSKAPSLSFDINGFNITITPDDYIEEETFSDSTGEHTKGHLKIVYNNFLRMSFVIGTFALMKQHMMFDYENNKIGFIAIQGRHQVDQKAILKSMLLYFTFGMSSIIILSFYMIFIHRDIVFCFKKKKYQLGTQ